PIERYPFCDGYVTLSTTESVIARKRPELQALVSAAFAASKAFASDQATIVDVMREECLTGLKEHFDIPDDSALRDLYAKLAEGMTSPPLPTTEGILNACRLQRDSAPEMLDFNPLLMWDFSFAREAMRTA